MDSNNSAERASRTEKQRIRRLKQRSCGLCRQTADFMLPWGGQHIPICMGCNTRITGHGSNWRDNTSEKVSGAHGSRARSSLVWRAH